MNACDQAGLLVAIEGCLEHAKTALYRNTADVADAMGGPTRDAVYKWTQTARLPLLEVPAFERATGAVCVTKYLAQASGHLLVKAPTPASAPQLDFARVQWQVAKAVLAAASANVDPAQAHEAVRSITIAIEGLAMVRQQLAEVQK